MPAFRENKILGLQYATAREVSHTIGCAPKILNLERLRSTLSDYAMLVEML
jgi:hypothetical protein